MQLSLYSYSKNKLYGPNNQNNNTLELIKIKGIGGSNIIFFTKNNIGSYMKALSTNYKPVFIELENII